MTYTDPIPVRSSLAIMLDSIPEHVGIVAITIDPKLGDVVIKTRYEEMEQSSVWRRCIKNDLEMWTCVGSPVEI